MIVVNRRWNNKGRLAGVRICTTDGYVDAAWAKNGEPTVVYGKFGKKPRRVVGLPAEGMEFGDSVGRQHNLFNCFVLRRQSIIKKCDASLILDGKEMPSDQMVFALNRTYMSREEKRAAESAMSQIIVEDQNKTELRKLALVGVLFNLSQEEAKEVMEFAKRVKTRNRIDTAPGL